MFYSTVLLVLSLLFPLYQSSGYIELRLKSKIDLPDARIYENRREKWDDSIPFPMIAHETRTLTIDNVDFHKRRWIQVDSGKLAECGRDFTSITTHGMKDGPRFSNAYIAYPFTGVRMDYLCHRNWYGPNCDTFCNNDHAKIIDRRCTQNGTIGCPLNFYGPNCDQDIDQNGPECKCKNKGVCVSSFHSSLVSKDELFCECPVGWKGKTCEEKNPPESFSFGISSSWKENCHAESHWPIANEFYDD